MTAWNRTANTANSFGASSRIITPGNTDLDPVAKSVVMLAPGNITIVPEGNANSDTLTFTGLGAGQLVPFIVRRVTACSSSCATID